MQATKALTSLRQCADSPEHLLQHNLVSTKTSRALAHILKYDEINDLFIVACANQNGSFYVTYSCLCSLSTSNLSLYFLHILKKSNDVIDTCRFTDAPFIINAPVCRCFYHRKKVPILNTNPCLLPRKVRIRIIMKRILHDWLACFINEPLHEISNNVLCATSKGSDQPAHTRSLIRAFARRLNIL